MTPEFPTIIAQARRCGHDPKNPQLHPLKPIKKGKGGLPRILSLAAEAAKAWYYSPEACPLLNNNPNRQLRSERREACQVVLEYLLSRVDLASLCIGTPTLNNGFVDTAMKSIVEGTGLGQRRCERAITQLKQAGFMTVEQPRYRNSEGKYVGLRAIRVLTERLFQWLGLGPMLDRERARASQALKAKLAKYGRNLSDVMRRGFKKVLRPIQERRHTVPQEIQRRWNDCYKALIRAGIDFKEAQRQVNARFGYPQNWSPGMSEPQIYSTIHNR